MLDDDKAILFLFQTIVYIPNQAISLVQYSNIVPTIVDVYAKWYFILYARYLQGSYKIKKMPQLLF